MAPSRVPSRFDNLLTGLQAGMLGGLAYLAWMCVSGVLLRRGFWDVANLLATGVERYRLADRGFSAATVFGIAGYLVTFSLLGAVLGVTLKGRMESRRLWLVSAIFGIAWYYVAFRWLWPALAPMAAFYHVPRAAVLGHALYGAVMGRYLSREPVMERSADSAPETPAAPETDAEH